MNRAELEHYIVEVYSTLWENPWAQSPTNNVLRHRHNRKWFAIIRGGGRALSEVGGVHPSVSYADSIQLRYDCHRQSLRFQIRCAEHHPQGEPLASPPNPIFVTAYGRVAQRMYKEEHEFVTHGPPGLPANNRNPCHPEHSVCDFGFHDCRWQSYLRKMRSVVEGSWHGMDCKA